MRINFRYADVDTKKHCSGLTVGKRAVGAWMRLSGQPWAFVLRDEGHFLGQFPYGKYGVDPDGNVMVAAFGRKLESVRLLSGRDLSAPIHGICCDDKPQAFLHIGLSKEYKEDVVYFYAVDYIPVKQWSRECMVEDSEGFYYAEWVETDENLFSLYPELHEYCRIEGEGLFRRWIWAYEWVMMCGNIEDRTAWGM